MFTPKIGEDEPILTIIFFHMGGKKPPTSKAYQATGLDVQNFPEEFEKACMQDTEEVVKVKVMAVGRKIKHERLVWVLLYSE